MRVVEAEFGMVVECAESGYCGAIVGYEHGAVALEDRFGKVRYFPLAPAAFLVDGEIATLVRPTAKQQRLVSKSGSVLAPRQRAQVAKASRIWVEGTHDAELIEKVWGHDLRAEAIVVEPMHGADNLVALIEEFEPGSRRRLGILLDHLVAGSKETRLASEVDSAHVLIAGHPFVDVWAAVKPAKLGLRAWPEVPRGIPWKEGVSRALGRDDLWQTVLSRVDSYHDLETPLVNAVERLIDHVTAS
ncbi:DUF3097 family protein [Allorhizocola rhizosphaerae]|uniref:DUF3097 family protein n=1 Tax=Allorhizocola rhizosphaerae TaxID=1872709 RepID=UPI000E3C5957|nr:DUF3097 family protein [Allorhizocola rhizosphaerae]